MNNYINLSENTLRQQMDSNTVFEEYLRVARDARRLQGGMYWKKQGEYEYLVKTSPDGKQQRLGTRSEETEKTYAAFNAQKTAAEERLAALRESVREAERLNKALRVGRTPGLLVSILEMLEQHGLAQHFTVVGTHALYAYEAAAGVRIEAGALATHDVDMLWDAGKHVRFYADIQRLDTSMLKLLQKVDSSFRRKDHELSSAINSKGFEVDFLRREQQGNDPHPIQLSKDPNDLFVVQARRANILTQASTFEQVVASATGKMAMMRTIDPGVFVSFKEWMSTEAPDRPQPKRRRDALQARVVRQLLEEQLLIAS